MEGRAAGRTRREVLRGGLALAGLGLLAGCGRLPPPAQPPARVHRLGFLVVDSAEATAVFMRPILEALAELGYVEGRNLDVEMRAADGREEQFPALAAELVQAKVDLIVTQGTPASLAAKGATGTIPIVTATTDPVGTGLVQSLARPGGNVTGTTNYNPDLTAKKLQLLREIVPGAARVAFLTNPNNPTYAAQERELEAAGAALGVGLQRLEVRAPAELEPAFRAAAEGRAEALLVLADSLVFVPQRERIARLAIDGRLPAMVIDRLGVEAGGLVAYGENRAALNRTRAAIVDKILKGANPADIPIEGPKLFDLTVNLQTARAIGLTIPDSVLQQAAEIIQ
jgi:putative tryptophan/tyrosine transport system substrate-binding protein